MKKIRLLILLFCCLTMQSYAARTLEELGIRVTGLPAFPNRGYNGYVTYRMHFVNKTNVEKTITISMTTSYASELEKVSRTFKLAAGESKTDGLFYPVLDFSSDGVQVEVDGVPLSEKLFPYARSYRNYYGKRQALVDNKVPRSDFERVFGGSSGYSGSTAELEMNQFEGGDTQYDHNWLAYTQFNVLIFYSESLKRMTAEAREAIFNYVRAGGSMLVLGNYPLPDDFISAEFPNPNGIVHFQGFEAGFGRAFTVPADTLSTVATMPDVPFPDLVGGPFARISSRSDLPLPFEDRELETVTTRWLMIVIYAFAFIIGPVNVYVLHKMGKKIWVFWTVPVASVICCLIIFGYYILFESSTLLVKKRALTFLDEANNRAVTLGNLSVFSSSSRPEGFHFSFDTDVWPLMVSSYSSNDRGKYIVLDEDQHFADGWIRPKIPRYFHLRSIHTRRERLTLERENGRIRAMNGLGAYIERLYVMLDGDEILECRNIAAGEAGLLNRSGMSAFRNPVSMRKLYEKQWYDGFNDLHTHPAKYLKPGMYVAILKGTPFLDKQVFSSNSDVGESIVVGLLSSGGPK
ncbi:MAG: hypothetical protein Kow0029_10100 [Candidatus Rifleibacteriota bacterium]